MGDAFNDQMDDALEQLAAHDIGNCGGPHYCNLCADEKDSGVLELREVIATVEKDSDLYRWIEAFGLLDV